MGDAPEGFRYDPELFRVALEAERWQAIRSGFAEWLVWIGIPLWVMAIHPHLFPAGVDRLVLALWSIVCILFVCALATEWKWRRRRARYRVEDRR